MNPYLALPTRKLLPLALPLALQAAMLGITAPAAAWDYEQVCKERCVQRSCQIWIDSDESLDCIDQQNDCLDRCDELPECTVGAHCASGSCVNGACTTPCTSDLQCQKRLRSPDGRCVEGYGCTLI
jgi:hypothetical protein